MLSFGNDFFCDMWSSGLELIISLIKFSVEGNQHHVWGPWGLSYELFGVF